MTQTDKTNIEPWYTRTPLLVGLALAVVALLAGAWLSMGGQASPSQQKETVYYSTGSVGQPTGGAPANNSAQHSHPYKDSSVLEGSASDVVDAPMRITLRVPWSTGSTETALAAVAVGMFDREGKPARFGPITGGVEAMRPALEIGVWVYDGSMPSDPGEYHARFILQKLNGPAQILEINEPELTSIPEGGPPLTSGYVFASSSNLWLLSTGAQREKRLTFVPAYFEYADQPAWSPDGSQIAYTYSPKTAPDELPLTSVWAINADGSNPHAVVQHGKDESLLDPAWSPDGKTMYCTVQTEQPISDTLAPLGNAQQDVRIDKIDIASGARTQWSPNASMPSVGKDWIVFVQSVYFLDGDGYTVTKYRLQYSNLDGSESRVLIDENSFQSLYMPSISPDGKWAVFAAVSAPPKQLSSRGRGLGIGGWEFIPNPQSPAPNPYFDPWRLLSLQPETAHAHGLPWELFLVSTAGGGAPIQLTQMNEDQPRPIWLDNTTTAFMGTSGLYKVTIDQAGHPVGEPEKVHAGAPHGGLTWHRP